MTSRELTSGFSFWSRGHLRMARSVMSYSWPTLSTRHAICADGRLSVCCLSHGHISETQQDRPTVTTEH